MPCNFYTCMYSFLTKPNELKLVSMNKPWQLLQFLEGSYLTTGLPQYNAKTHHLPSCQLFLPPVKCYLFKNEDFFFSLIFDSWENSDKNLLFTRMTYILHFAFIRVHDPDSENKFFSIVIIEDAVQVITKSYKIKHHADYNQLKITFWQKHLLITAYSLKG